MVTDCVQHWHVLPKRSVAPQTLTNLEFHKKSHAKQVHTKDQAAPLAHQQTPATISQLTCGESVSCLS